MKSVLHDALVIEKCCRFSEQKGAQRLREMAGFSYCRE